jgi:hypothetical protein
MSITDKIRSKVYGWDPQHQSSGWDRLDKPEGIFDEDGADSGSKGGAVTDRPFQIGDRILTTTGQGQESGRVVWYREVEGIVADFVTLTFVLDTPGTHRDLSPRTMGEIHLTADRTSVLNDAHAIELLAATAALGSEGEGVCAICGTYVNDDGECACTSDVPIGHIDHNRVTECDECGKCIPCCECTCYDFEWPIDPDDRMAPMSGPCDVALAAARAALLGVTA